MKSEVHNPDSQCKLPNTCIIVDDEPLARARLERILSNERSLEIIGSYGEPRFALAQIIKHRPDIVFLDVEMPGMNGFEMEKELRKVSSNSNIVFVTGNFRAIHQLEERHDIDFLVKPVEKTEIEEILKSNLIK